MDFDLSADQVALRDGATDLLDGYASAAQVRAVSDAGERFDRELWAAMVEQGWLGVAFEESLGGLGLGVVELAVLCEAIGAHVAPVPFLPTVLAARALYRSGDLEAAESIVAGNRVGCVAWSRNPGAVRASASGGVWRLDGRADPTIAAPLADIVIVVAQTSDGPGLFSVALSEQSRPPREPAMDLTRPLGWLEFTAHEAQWLGGADAVEQAVDDGAVLTSCEMLGTAQRALDMSVEYAKDRVQFGKPIGSFQAVKHRCADMLVDVEGMRSTAYWAAWSLGADDDASVAASTAKCWASDAAKRVMASALQVHGGIGFTWEHDLHFLLKRSQLDQLQFGNASFHRQRLAALLRPRIVAGNSVV